MVQDEDAANAAMQLLYNPCKLCLTLPIDRQRPKNQGVRRLLSASPSFASPILILLLGLTGQTAALHLTSNKPQEAADCSLCDEILKCCARKLSWLNQGLKFHADLVTPFIGGNMGGSAYHRSSSIIKP